MKNLFLVYGEQFALPREEATTAFWTSSCNQSGRRQEWFYMKLNLMCSLILNGGSYRGNLGEWLLVYRKRYDKDELMHQPFTEEKLSNMSNVLPERFVGLLSRHWWSTFWFTAVNCGSCSQVGFLCSHFPEQICRWQVAAATPALVLTVVC